MASSECGGNGETYSSAAPFEISKRAVAGSTIATRLTPSSRADCATLFAIVFPLKLSGVVG